MPLNILVTGSKGFVGKNLICTLEALKDGRLVLFYSRVLLKLV